MFTRFDDLPVVKVGEPCSPTCLNHVSHPCEKCGRIGGRTPYPILWGYIEKDLKEKIEYYPLSYVENHRKQIESNHGQTIEQLADRGGLHPAELYMAMIGMRATRLTTSLAKQAIQQIATDLNWHDRVNICENCQMLTTHEKFCVRCQREKRMQDEKSTK